MVYGLYFFALQQVMIAAAGPPGPAKVKSPGLEELALICTQRGLHCAIHCRVPKVF